MSLLNSLKALANKLGLVHVVSVADPGQPQKITTRTLTLRDLAAEIKAADVKALADTPANYITDFNQIFSTAGIKAPAHGWTLAKLQDFLGTAALNANLSEETQHTVLSMLASQNAPVEDIIKDAVARDQAMDAYASALYRKRQERRASQSEEKAQIQAQLAALATRLKSLDSEIASDDQRWQQWWQRKLRHEQQMAAALNVLLKETLISIDDQLPADEN